MNNEQQVVAKMMIRKPVHEVFDAFIDPSKTTKFWFSKSSGKLNEHSGVTWRWETYNLDIQVSVLEIEDNKSILLSWGEGIYYSKIKWDFQDLGNNKTFVIITNFDFKMTEKNMHNHMIDSTGGFTLVLAGAKAFLEHSIQLGLVEDKWPKEMW